MALLETLAISEGASKTASEDAPAVAPEVAPEVAVEVAVEDAPEVAPEVSHDGALEVSPEIAPEDSPKVAPEVSPDGALEVSQEVSQEDAHEVIPKVLREASRKVPDVPQLALSKCHAEPIAAAEPTPRSERGVRGSHALSPLTNSPRVLSPRYNVVPSKRYLKVPHQQLHQLWHQELDSARDPTRRRSRAAATEAAAHKNDQQHQVREIALTSSVSLVKRRSGVIVRRVLV